MISRVQPVRDLHDLPMGLHQQMQAHFLVANQSLIGNKPEKDQSLYPLRPQVGRILLSGPVG